MIKKIVLREVDRIIKETWKKDISSDYWHDYLDKEDTLKCDLYYHLRRKLKRILKENNLRIFTEYFFSVTRYKADIVIVELDPYMEYDYLQQAVVNIVALFELKFTSSSNDRTADWVKNDLWKFKVYHSIEGLETTQFYSGTIYEIDCDYLTWLDARSTNNWANGRVTELVSGKIDGKMKFEVHSYNGMNKGLND